MPNQFHRQVTRAIQQQGGTTVMIARNKDS